MGISIICFALTACALEKVSELEPRRNEWQPFSAKESDGNWRTKYAGKALKIVDDFNGDGRMDEALLLISTNNSSLGLFAVFSNGTEKQFLVEKFANIKIPEAGIVVAPPGEYLTTCAKAYTKCAPGEKRSIILLTSGIEIFEFESAHILFYWDKNTGAFIKEWLSD